MITPGAEGSGLGGEHSKDGRVGNDGEANRQPQGGHRINEMSESDHPPNRLFTCLPASESGVASVGPVGALTRNFAGSGGYRSNR